MSDYIDFGVVGRVIATGLLLGAGLPLVFALGLRALSVGVADTTTGATTSAVTGSGDFAFRLTDNQGARAVGAFCFLVVAAAIVFGIFIIVHKS